MTKSNTLTFRECTLDLLEQRFGLSQRRQCDRLDQWLALPAAPSDWETQALSHLSELLARNVHDWNENELSQQFIGPLFALVDFTTDHFNLFAEREFSGEVQGVVLRGEPDGMIAAGRRSPHQPYFCFQEYKRERDPKGDPAGQCLAAMLVAQALNEQKHPIYGCHIIGELWRFMLLQGDGYCISKTYLSTDDGVFEIFRILCGLKQTLLTQVKS